MILKKTNVAFISYAFLQICFTCFHTFAEDAKRILSSRERCQKGSACQFNFFNKLTSFDYF